MSNQIKPLSNRVLVRPTVAESKTASGIFIPDSAKEKPQKGTVIAVGPGKIDEPMSVRTDDTVLYGKYTGVEVVQDGETLLLMREDDVLAIIKNNY